MVYLASSNQGEKTHIARIAESEKIPRKFLESIMLELKKAGYLGAQKGKGGGYYLLKGPEEIAISDVYRVLEGPIAPVPCVSLNFYEKCEDCKNEATCEIHLLMVKVRDSALDIYTNTFVSDLILQD